MEPVEKNTVVHAENRFTLIQYRTPVGYWRIGQLLTIAMYHKPNWFHRKMHKLILGWEWEDK